MTRPSPFLRCAEAFDARPGFAEVTELLRAMVERMDAVDDYRCVEAWEYGPPRPPQEPASGRREVVTGVEAWNGPTRCTRFADGSAVITTTAAYIPKYPDDWP